MDIIQEAENIEEEVVSFRRELHLYPELAGHEVMTTEYIRERLEEWGISYRLVEPAGVIGVIGSGSYTTALRADMDGLEVEEETELSFRSQNSGCMHACGHDGHMAILLAAAKILKEHENELDHRIMLVFQPAEEIAQGAADILETGILNQADRIFGLHIFSGIEKGKISLEPGPRMASTNWFSIRIGGKSGHAGKPQECVDAAVVAASLAMNLQTIISRSINPLESAVLTIGRMEAGTARNVIAGDAVLEGTVRTFSGAVQEQIRRRMEEIVEAAGQMYHADISLDFQPASHPALRNDERVVRDVMRQAAEVFSEDDFVHVPPMMLGEDFANYLMEIRGCFAFIGGGGRYPNHHSMFDFDEDILVQGVKLMLVFASV
ncbi:MAG TPA: amidohydrolase [Candidatus Anaerostipes avistercoris]|uniref:Amidohydrolase n=1 Tax=Candidatus Anaerostipes avistercoris TaxID=2838462 RepID=A0A9D2TAE0_9FIRM|nr:amidohydrolase [uncultured Anaerostipes sp.]HJC51211.1 amidohydrolase [Candidatus Anaerostipes avistercoris]